MRTRLTESDRALRDQVLAIIGDDRTRERQALCQIIGGKRDLAVRRRLWDILPSAVDEVFMERERQRKRTSRATKAPASTAEDVPLDAWLHEEFHRSRMSDW